MNPIPNHKPLNDQQIDVLRQLYRFRFATDEILAASLGDKSRRYMHERCKTLLAQELIGQRYDKSYKLLGQPTSYYITTKGIAVLKVHPTDDLKLEPNVLRLLKNDYRSSELFARHCLTIFRASLRLSQLYGPDLKFLSKSQLRTYDYFPKPKPDGYAYKMLSQNQRQHYMIECFDDTMPQSVMRETILRHLDHFDSGDWLSDSPYPLVIIFYQNDKLRNRLDSWISSAQADSFNDVVQFKIIK